MVKYCPKCGYPNPDNAMFCARCGYDLRMVQPTPQVPPPQPYQQPPQYGYPPQQPPPYQPPYYPSKRRFPIKAIIGIIVAVVVVLVVFFVVLPLLTPSLTYNMISTSQAASVFGGKWIFLSNESATGVQLNSSYYRVTYANGTPATLKGSGIPGCKFAFEVLEGFNTSYGNDIYLYVFKAITPNSTDAMKVYKNYSNGNVNTIINGYDVYINLNQTDSCYMIVGVKGNTVVVVEVLGTSVPVSEQDLITLFDDVAGGGSIF